MAQKNGTGVNQDASAHQGVLGETETITGVSHAKALGVHDAVAVKVDDALFDLARAWPVEKASTLALVRKGDAETLSFLRHDAAHLLAQAVKELYPRTQVAIGPSTADGFYYDFLFETPLGEDALPAIEARMHELVQRDDALTREEWSRDEALAFFEKENESACGCGDFGLPSR
jgi:threonyl-tRNA synthetase